MVKTCINNATKNISYSWGFTTSLSLFSRCPGLKYGLYDLWPVTAQIIKPLFWRVRWILNASYVKGIKQQEGKKTKNFSVLWMVYPTKCGQIDGLKENGSKDSFHVLILSGLVAQWTTFVPSWITKISINPIRRLYGLKLYQHVLIDLNLDLKIIHHQRSRDVASNTFINLHKPS